MSSSTMKQPELVFIHGWCCDSSHWDQHRSSFSDNHEVLTLDLPGHGENSHKPGPHLADPSAGMREIALMVNPQLQTLTQSNNVILIGHSMGGAVCLELARLNPGLIRGVIPVDTFLLDLGGMDKDTMSRLGKAFAGDFRQALMKMIEQSISPDSPESLRTEIFAPMSRSNPEQARAFWEALVHWDPTPTLQACEAPIHAINSPGVSHSTRQRLSPFMRDTVIPNTGHFLHLESPARFIAAVKETIIRLGENNSD